MKIGHSYKLFYDAVILLFIMMGIVIFRTLNIQNNIIIGKQHRYPNKYRIIIAIEIV